MRRALEANNELVAELWDQIAPVLGHGGRSRVRRCAAAAARGMGRGTRCPRAASG